MYLPNFNVYRSVYRFGLFDLAEPATYPFGSSFPAAWNYRMSPLFQFAFPVHLQMASVSSKWFTIILD